MAEHRAVLRLDLGELRPQQLVDDLRVGPSLRLLHHLADEEAQESLLATLVCGNLARVVGKDAVDERLQLGCVGDQRVTEVGVGTELGVRALRQGARERLRGIVARAAITFASSSAFTAAGSTPVATKSFIRTFEAAFASTPSSATRS